MTDTGRFLTALRRVFGGIFGSAGAASGSSARSDAAGSASVATDLLSPGRNGPAATVEIDPDRLRGVRLSYSPSKDGAPDPGEIVWTWVPYEERDGRGKDRPVVIIAASGAESFLAVQLTSKAHGGSHDFVPLGTGAWDSAGRPSWANIDRVFVVHAAGMRREAASLDAARYLRLAEAIAARYGWS
ncbi:rhodanese-related sulfurtransferase [Agromyces terreus]|uniref:Rhodanese-related sulfurtransferase n=1 Tax=Agromyces terreus TaxID=424795 RepID=A0A9X2GZQ0_9MICO|nr:type II toxin-antitoxin system PemK/MazF family toxin [Agromyces terreus]MCP2372120.1 rhodanese-related sulfurtransferase [Agromyces terreus]